MLEKKSSIGVAVIGCGTIGSLRAKCLSWNPGVSYIAVCDIVQEKARKLAGEIGADAWSIDCENVINNPNVDAVIVSTSEGDHYDPLLTAVNHRKTILVEKPFVLKLSEASDILEQAKKKNVDIFLGYTQRFRRRFLTVKEQIMEGYLGKVDSAFTKIYLTKAIAEAVLARAPHTTASLNTLTYNVDLILWYMEQQKPAFVFAQSVSNIYKNPNNTPDATWAILKFEDGAICTFGTSWQLPKQYPGVTATMQLELFGPKGIISIDDSHKDYILTSELPIPAPYTPELKINNAFVGSAMPGDWALGRFWGPMKTETDTFVESIIAGEAHPTLPTGEHGYKVLEITLAIDKAAKTGEIIKLPLKE